MPIGTGRGAASGPPLIPSRVSQTLKWAALGRAILVGRARGVIDVVGPAWGVGLGVRVRGVRFGVWALGFGVWCLVFGIWCLGFGVSGLGSWVEESERGPLGQKLQPRASHSGPDGAASVPLKSFEPLLLVPWNMAPRVSKGKVSQNCKSYLINRNPWVPHSR